MALLMVTFTTAWADDQTSTATVTKDDFVNGEVVWLSTANCDAANWITVNSTSTGKVTPAVDIETGGAYEGEQLTVYRVKQWKSRYLEFKITGVSEIELFANCPNTTATRTLKATVNETKEQNAKDVVTIVATESLQGSGKIALDTDKENTIRVYADGDLDVYAIKVTTPVVEPTNKTIFLVPGPWDASDATEQYAAWVWKGDEAGQWFKFSPAEEDGVFTVAIPADMTGLKLARFSSEVTEFSFDNAWNTTDDVDITDIADNTLFTITGWNSCQTSPYVYITSMTVVGDVAGAWVIADGWTMTRSTEDAAVWTVTKEDVVLNVTTYGFKAVANEAWGVRDIPETSGENKNITITEKGIYTITVTVNTDSKSIDVTATKTANVPIEAMTVVGTFLGLEGDANWAFENGWALVQNTENTSEWSLTKEDIELKAGDYEYKIVANNDWNDYALPASGNASFTCDADGVYTLVFTANTESGEYSATATKEAEIEPEFIYAVVGTGGIFTTAWDVPNAPDKMTLDEESGLYTWSVKNAQLDAQTIEFKVIKKDVKGTVNTEYYPNDNQTIDIPEDGYYTITITFNAENGEVAATSVMREKPIYADNNVYSWESPDGIVDENGGTIAYVNGEGNRLNYQNGGYYTICLNGKKGNMNDATASSNAGKMVITLDKALMAGDVIDMTAYINKSSSTTASAYFVFENGTTMEGTVYGNEANIDPAFNGVPTKTTYTVTAAAAGSKTITMTRNIAGTNLFITKLEITRPIEYYLVGTFNMEGENWVLGDENYKLTKNEEATGEEYSITVALPANTELKVWKNTDVWFPAGAGNFTINDAGTYTIYFRPNADGGDDWYQNCIYAQWVHGAVTLNEEEDNTNILTDWNGREADVTLTRTLQTGGWNTFAVPFNKEIPTEWTVKELASTSLNGETLTLTFQDATTSFEAGKPYLVKVPDTVENPIFYNVTISNEVEATETDYVDFIPTLGKTAFTGNDKDAILFLAAGNKLQNPTDLSDGIKGFRAYFLLKNVNSAREFVLDFGDGETTGITDVRGKMEDVRGGYYDLQGRRINSAAQKGVYIVNGKKTVIK